MSWTKAHQAAELGNSEVLRELGGQLKTMCGATDSYGQTPLFIAAKSFNDEVVSMLLLGDPMQYAATNAVGMTPLHHAAKFGNNLTAERLLSCAPSVALREAYVMMTAGVGSSIPGGTALHFAAKAHNRHLYNLLMEAAPRAAAVRDSSGKTPAEYDPESITIFCGSYARTTEKLSGPSSHAVLRPGGGMLRAPNAFFTAVANKLDRDYVILCDGSAMMAGGLWKRQCAVLGDICEHIAASFGASVDLFVVNRSVQVYTQLKTRDDIHAVERQVDLSSPPATVKALTLACSRHFDSPRAATSILVIMLDPPDSSEDALRNLARVANAVEWPAELSVSFIQFGSNPSTTAFLRAANEVSGKADIVDILTCAEVPSTEEFSSVIGQCLRDPSRAGREVKTCVQNQRKYAERWWAVKEEAR